MPKSDEVFFSVVHTKVIYFDIIKKDSSRFLRHNHHLTTPERRFVLVQEDEFIQKHRKKGINGLLKMNQL
jgi:hypothetical protein